MKIVEQLHSGLNAGVTRHWRYTKEMFDIKPEYLMTVAVADALSEGYDDIHGLDIQIRLECPTRQIAYQLVSDAVGLKQWFAIKKDVKINRKGRADILATADKTSHLVELKGFDPSKAQIEKELVRIQEFFALNAGQNTLRAGHIVFPSLVTCRGRLEKYGRTLLTDPALTFEVVCRKHETDEDPEDGMPVYFTNSLSVSRADA
jgi:hypothetical protein